MGRFGTAMRAFFRILGDTAIAERVERVLNRRTDEAIEELQPPTPSVATAPRAAVQATKPATGRSEALDLLAAMQREARLVDFLKESLSEYSDAQIGAAVRDIHRDCAKLVDRLFDLQPIEAGEEGAPIELPAGYEASRYRLAGNVTGQLPLRGRLVHRGWQAGRVEVPAWTGGQSAARVIVPAEVEIS